MNANEMREVLSKLSVPEFQFKIHSKRYIEVFEDGSHSEPFDTHYLQGHYIEPDVRSGLPEPQSTRKWYVSTHATKSELAQTAFKCYLTSMEHQARESFLYRNKRVFGPHFDVDILAEIVGKDANLDYRRTEPEPRETGPFKRRPDLDCVLHKWASMGGGCPTCAMHHTYTI